MALDSIELKIRSCVPSLEEIEVNLKELLRQLLRWFTYKPITKEHTVLTIILSLLKVSQPAMINQICLELKNYNFLFSFQSNFSDETKRILKSEKQFDKLTALRSLINIRPTRELLREILFILKNTEEYDVTGHNCDHFPTLRNNYSPNPVNGYTFTTAWETPITADLNSMHSLKNALQSNVDQENLNHAMQYFEGIVKDYPGEYFLQSPYLFDVNIYLEWYSVWNELIDLLLYYIIFRTFYN